MKLVPSQKWIRRLGLGLGLLSINAAAEPDRPNFIVIFANDLGYGDLGCFGSETIKTPNIDRMAREGLKLTSFYAQTVCGPSRPALLTGSYPLRVATSDNKVAVHPHLHSKEITVAEVLHQVGYKSIAIGKWDVAGHSQKLGGSDPKLYPTQQDFDEFFGTPSSNDRIVNLVRGDQVIETETDMSQLTRRFTDEAIQFIKTNTSAGENGRDPSPFFVYLAHSMPHVELAVSKAFRGKSAGGLYRDVVEEIDFNVGRILQTLEDEGLDENTTVIFTSDNDPWFFGRSAGHKKRFGENWAEHGGSAAPLRGAKTSSWEGGLRVPFVIRAPGRIPAGSESDIVAATIDLMPTLAALAGGETPTDRIIDGRNISSLLETSNSHQVESKPYFYYLKTRLAAVRFGKWKLHVPRPIDPQWEKYSTMADAAAIAQPALFNLNEDIAETENVAAQHPKVVAELLKHIHHARTDIADHDRIGKNARFFDPGPRRTDILAEL